MASNPSAQQLPIALRLRRVRSVAGLRLPLVVLVGLFYLILLPEQANLRIGGVLLPPYRLYLILYLPFIVFHAFRGSFRLVWSDFLIIAACGWIWLASYMTGSLGEAVLQGGAHTVDIGIVYFAARFGIQSARDFRLFLILAAPGVALMGAVVMLESLTGRYIIQPLISEITGVPNRLANEYRLGLMRGAASFPHPILAGICLASFLPLYFMAGLRGWPKMFGWIGGIASFFTLSSAAILGLFVGMALVIYDWLAQRLVQVTWRVFLIVAGTMITLIELVSTSGSFSLLIKYASLNTASAYNRVLIWQFGTQNVANNPWFGIGYQDWERPSWMQWPNSFSMDNFWLLMAVRFGLPVSLLLLIVSVIVVAWLAWRSASYKGADARLMRGVAISLAIFALGAGSVSLWLNALVWYFLLLGMAVGLVNQTQLRLPAPTHFPGRSNLAINR